MPLLPSPEDFSSASGIINMPFLNSLYRSLIDEATVDMGRTVRFHLPPTKVQDPSTQGQNQPSQFNSYFGRVQAPLTNRRNTGVTVTSRDIDFTAHIRIGPKTGDDSMGIGDLKANQAVITVDISALKYATEAQSVSIEGRRYEIDETRPVGLTRREYLMVFLTEINSTSVDNSENAG